MIIELREWLMFIAELGILYYVAREFYYDRDKDIEKKQRRTRTTKKTTNKAGESIVEETTETTTPFEGDK